MKVPKWIASFIMEQICKTMRMDFRTSLTFNRFFYQQRTLWELHPIFYKGKNLIEFSFLFTKDSEYDDRRKYDLLLTFFFFLLLGLF